MISISDLCKNFGRLQVLKSVDAHFDSGKSYALMGPNGCGKTTLIKCILGMVLPDSGEIVINGKSIKGDWGYRQQIGYMPQLGRYPDQMKIGQLFDMVRDIRQHPSQVDDDLVKEFKLDEIKDKRMHTLSGGTRQKVSAALAFLFSPGFLILDEPTAGLDPIAAEVLKEKIMVEKNNNKSFLITSHIVSEVDELANHMIYMNEGKVLFHDTIDLLKEETGEQRLGKAIATFMKGNLNQPETV